MTKPLTLFIGHWDAHLQLPDKGKEWGSDHRQLVPGVPSDSLDSKAGSPTPASPSTRWRLGPAVCKASWYASKHSVCAHARSRGRSPLPHQGDVDAVGSCNGCKGHKSANQWGKMLGEKRCH